MKVKFNNVKGRLFIEECYWNGTFKMGQKIMKFRAVVVAQFLLMRQSRSLFVNFRLFHMTQFKCKLIKA